MLLKQHFSEIIIWFASYFLRASPNGRLPQISKRFTRYFACGLSQKNHLRGFSMSEIAESRTPAFTAQIKDSFAHIPPAARQRSKKIA